MCVQPGCEDQGTGKRCQHHRGGDGTLRHENTSDGLSRAVTGCHGRPEGEAECCFLWFISRQSKTFVSTLLNIKCACKRSPSSLLSLECPRQVTQTTDTYILTVLEAGSPGCSSRQAGLSP